MTLNESIAIEIVNRLVAEYPTLDGFNNKRIVKLIVMDVLSEMSIGDKE